MTFVHPILAIAGAACVAVPIIIHILMRRRRKPVPWAAMRFLLEAFRQQRRRLRLEQLLLLAARCLLVLLVGIAIARPLLGSAGLLSGRGPMTMYLLVDNGLASSAAEGGAGSESSLARHKKLAAELLRQLDPAMGDRAGLIALGGPAESLVVPASSDASAVGELVGGIAATDSATDVEGAFATLRAQFDHEAGASGEGSRGASGRTVVVVLSDYLRGSADTERPLPALAPAGMGDRITLVSTAPARDGAGNITVTGVEPLRTVAIAGAAGGSAGPAAQAQVRVALRRSGPAVGEAASTAVRVEAGPVSLRAGRASAGGAQPSGRAVVRWSAGQAEATASVAVPMPATMDLEGSALVLTASIDHDAIPGDNVSRRPVEVRSVIRVGLVAPHRARGAASVQQFEPGDWFRLALEPEADSGGRGVSSARGAEFEFSEIDPGAIDASRVAGLDALFVPRPDAIGEDSWRRLRAFVDTGGLLIVCPPPGTAVNLWPDAMAKELGLGWSPGREARAADQGLTIATERTASAPGEDLLALIGAELPEITAGVHFWRVLPVEFGPSRGGAALAAQVLLAASDGSPLVVAGAPGSAGEQAGAARRGLVVYIASAFSFDWTDVQARPLMVPLLQELVRQGVGRAHAPWSAVAGTRPEAPARTVELKAVSEDAGPAIAVGADGVAASPVRSGGLWRALDVNGTPRAVVAVNADPRAGDGQSQTPAAVEAWLLPAAGAADGLRWIDLGGEAGADTSAARDLRRTIDAEHGGDPFTVPLLLGAAALALLELALARWFSHAAAAQGSASAEGGGRWHGEAAA